MLKAYGKYQHQGAFKSKTYRKLVPAVPGVSQTRHNAIAITVKYKAGGGRGSILSYDQFEHFKEKEIRPFFRQGIKSNFLTVKEYYKGLVTFAVWPRDYKTYGSKLFSDPDDDGNHPIMINGEPKLVTAKIANVEKCYVYLPFMYY